MTEQNNKKRIFSKSPKIRFIYDPALRGVILDAFGKSSEKGGLLVDENGEHVLTQAGEKIKKKDFGGVVKGSEIYIKKEVDALLRYVEGRPTP